MFGIDSSQSTNMPVGEYMRSTVERGVLLLLVVTMISPGCHAVSTIYDVKERHGKTGATVTFNWTVTLDDGVTIETVQWYKQPTTLIAQKSAPGFAFTVSSIYSGRVQNPENEILELQNFSASDLGTYRCTVILSDLTSLDDTADLIMGEITKNATITNSTEGDNVTLICNSAGGIPSPSYIWMRDGIIIISTTSNTLVISPFEVDDVGNYSCIASNIAGNVTSNIIQLTLYVTGSVAILVLPCSLAAVILFECQAVFAAILVTTFIVANKLNNTKVMKDCASFGPVIGAVLAVVVIVIDCVVGDIQQWDIIAIVVVTAVALCLSIVAAVLGFLSKKTNGSLLHYVSMGLEIFLGLMVTIAGIVIVIIIANGTRPDDGCIIVVAIGGVCSVGSSGTACWCTCAMWKKKETTKVGQDIDVARLSGRNRRAKMNTFCLLLMVVLWLSEQASTQSVDDCGVGNPASCVAAERFVHGTANQPIEIIYNYTVPDGFSVSQIQLHKLGSAQLMSLINPPAAPIIAGPFQNKIEVTDTGTDVARTLTLKILSVTADMLDTYRATVNYMGSNLLSVVTGVLLTLKVSPNPILAISGYNSGAGVSAGQSLPLTCTSTQGKPPAQVTWWKGDVEQQQAVYSSTPDASTNQGDAMSVLTLAVQPANNQETYQCRVSQLGTELERQDLQLNVRFYVEGSSITGFSGPVTSGDSLTLTCTSGSSNPPATISWTRVGGVAITGTDQPQTDGLHGGKIMSQRIRFTNLQAQDNGAQFKCTVTNSAVSQSEEKTVTIDVQYAPINITVTCNPSDLREGSALVCTCTADSNPAAQYSWIYGTADPLPTGAVVDNTTGTLTFSTLYRAHSGEYSCTANNGISPEATNGGIAVNVKYAPTDVQVTCNPSDLSDLRELGALVCTCTADSYPAAQYSWTYSTAGYLPTVAMVDSTAGTLTFSALDRTHGGEYRCTANNGISPEATSDGITVDVKYPASITFITPPVTVDEYDDVSLTCTADSNPAPDNFSWAYMNGTTLAGTTSAEDFNLTTNITAITYQQAGMYTCTAGNGIGTADSEGTNVTVEYPPKFYPSIDPYPSAIGADVSMECSAFAVPNNITFSWSRNGTTLTNSSRLTIQSSGETSVLSISGVVQGDYGTYNCTATNGKGSSSTSRTLQPVGPPGNPSGLIVLSKNAKFEVRITWTAGFNGGLDTTHTVQLREVGADQWEYVGSREQTASEQQRTFNIALDLKAQQAGDYKIRINARNTQGEAWSESVDLKLEDVSQRLSGRMTTNENWVESLKDSESTEFRQKAALWERNLDKVFSSLIGYEGATITQFSQGSVVGDFEAVVAKSETQAAMEAFETQVNTGSVGDLTVVKESSQISVTRPPVGGDNTTVIIIAVAVCVAVLFAILCGVVFVVRRRRFNKKKSGENRQNNMELDRVRGDADDAYQSLRMPHRRTSDHTYQGLMAGSQNEKSPDETYVKTPSEFPRNQLDIKEELGQGEFGSVYKAEAWKIYGNTGVTTVAVKELKGMTSPASSTAFFKELSVLKLLGTHPNVVSFLGCCTDAEPFYLLLEYVSGGTLQSNLRTSRTQQTYGNLHGGSKCLSSRDLTKFAWDVTKGMCFLSAKKILHRDLATRNVQVSADRTCKVSDFGFSREGDEYERTTKTRLPIRWMAPESLFHLKYTTKTDVWAFGVLLWEIVTLGATPYPGMSKREVMDGVQQGYRMDKPKHCDEKLYTLMLSCWDADPARRPEFRKIQSTLNLLMETEHDFINLASLDENTYTSLQTASDEKY